MVAIKNIQIDCLEDGPGLEKSGYTFYPGFKYGSSKSNITKRIKVNQFFFVRISRHDDPCIGELVSIWKDKYRELFSSVRLYFLPEQTPDGRQSNHGQHEVLAASEPVILRLHDLVSWITEEVDWVTGLEACNLDPPAFTLPFLNLIKKVNINNNHHHNHNSIKDEINVTLKPPQITSAAVDINGVKVQSESRSVIVVLSYPKYCRYRAFLKKMEEDKENPSGLVNCPQAQQPSPLHLETTGISDSDNTTSATTPTTKASSSETSISDPIIESSSPSPTSPPTTSPSPITNVPNVRILFCRDTFEHEGLLHHDLNCEHLAPKLKGRPRKRGLTSSSNLVSNSNHNNSNSVSAAKSTSTVTSNHSSSSAQDSDTSEENSKQDSSRVRLPRNNRTTSAPLTKVKSSGVDCAFQGNSNVKPTNKSKPPAMSSKLAEKCLKNESEFMKQLNKFMKERNTPITRIPHLGFKKIDLFYLFTFTQKMGGYEKITQNKEWKKVYHELGGDPRSTSAATCTRRHFERLLLPFERHLAQARGIVVTRRSTRGRSISPLLLTGVGSGGGEGKGGVEEENQSIGSNNSFDGTSGRSRRSTSGRRPGVRQSKRLKGETSSSVAISNSSQATNVSCSVASGSSSATDDDECDSLMSHEEDNNNSNTMREEAGDGRQEMIKSKDRDYMKPESNENRSSKTPSPPTTTAAATTIKEQSNSGDDNHDNSESSSSASSSFRVRRVGDNKVSIGKETKDGDNWDSLTEDGLTVKSRSPSVELGNGDSFSEKRSQSERKFVVKIDGLSTGDLKIRSEAEEKQVKREEIVPEETVVDGKETTRSSKEKAKVDLDKVKSPDEPDGTIKTEVDPVELSQAGGLELGSAICGEKVKPLTEDPVNEVENQLIANCTGSGNNNNCDNNNNDNHSTTSSSSPTSFKVNEQSAKSDKIKPNNNLNTSNTNLSITGTANNENNVASPLSSISTLISAMDAAKQQQQVHLTREMKTENGTESALNNNSTTNYTNHNPNNLISPFNHNPNGNPNIPGTVQSSVNGIKRISHKSNNNHLFNTSGSKGSSSSSSGSTSLTSSGRPSVIQKTPLKPCVKVVPTYKDNPIDGLNKDNSLLKKTILPPIAHAASFTSSLTWFSQQQQQQPPPTKPHQQLTPFTSGSTSSPVTNMNSNNNSNHHPQNRNIKNINSNNFSCSSLKRKVAPSSPIQGSDSMFLPLDLTCKKRIMEVDSDDSKVVTPRGGGKMATKLRRNGNDSEPDEEGDNCSPTILDLSAKVARVTKQPSRSTLDRPKSGPSSAPQLNSSTNHSIYRSSLHQPQPPQPTPPPPSSTPHQQSTHIANHSLIPAPKVPKNGVNNNHMIFNERANIKSNPSKSNNNQNSLKARHANPSPLPVSSPVSGIPGILPAATPGSGSSTPTLTKHHHPQQQQQQHHPQHSSFSSSVNKNHQTTTNRSQMVKPSPSPNGSRVKESKSNHLSSSSLTNSGSGLKDLNQQQQLQLQPHLNGLSNQHTNHSHHQRRQQQQHQSQQQTSTSHHQQQQLPLLPGLPFPDSRDVQSKLQSANALNQLRAIVTPENLALAQQTLAQEIAFREMERFNPNLAKQMSQMSTAMAALGGYPPNFNPMLNPVHRSTPTSSSSPSISEYNPTLPSFLPFLSSFVPPGLIPGSSGPTGATPTGPSPLISSLIPTSNGTTGPGGPLNNAVAAAAAAALASGHFLNPAALTSTGQPIFLPIELLGGDERFAAAQAAQAAAAAAAAASENDARWRGWFE